MAQDTSTLTACINDYGPDDIFKRVFSSLSTTGDTLLAITTSGNSRNIIETLKLAREKGIFSLGFLGNGGGEALSYMRELHLLHFLESLKKKYLSL